MELNPNHPVTEESRHLWHKIVFMMMRKFDYTSVVFTAADVNRIMDQTNQYAVVVHSHTDSVEVKIVTTEEGERLAREAGGLPC